MTEDIDIIYNGPRRFVAVTKTTISDVGGGADLVAIYFTFVFNKAEKNVIILKDVKRLYSKQPMNIQFGNRGEWDLGKAGDTDSYTHWYTDHPVQYWDMDGNGDINATEVGTSFNFFKEYMITQKTPKKWWDDPPSMEIPDTVFNEFSEAAGEPFPDTWLETQPTCYGRDWHMDETIKDHSFAVAQVIARAGDYVGALAVWPHPEFWSAANTFFPPARTVAPVGENPSTIPLMLAPISRMLEWHKWTVAEDPNQGLEDDLDDRDDIWVKNDDIRMPDGTTLEPIIPFTIYEHDFELSSQVQEYRMVSVYMLTDYHDADDADADDVGNEETWSMGINVIDREIQYQIDEIFDPWDIYDAMHKNYKRWVQFYDAGWDDIMGASEGTWDGETYFCIKLDEYREVESGDLIPSLPVVRTKMWDAYCSFSERVLVDTGEGFELIYPDGYEDIDPIPGDEMPFYTINLATGWICFWEWDDDLEAYVPWYLPEGSLVKVLWSSEHEADTAEVWTEFDLLYPFDGTTYIFPLHHDIMPKYKEGVEVFYIPDEAPVALLEHGDFVYNDADAVIVLQDPPMPGQWLMINYTSGGYNRCNWYLGDGWETVFKLEDDHGNDQHAVTNLVVSTTAILQQIVLPEEPIVPLGTGIRVPARECYWDNNDGGDWEAASWENFGGLEEREWIYAWEPLYRGAWVIHESPVGNWYSTCDELVLDDVIASAPDSELKIVFQVPSGRWEWAIVGEPAATVDSLGAVSVVAAFKNKHMEFGLGGLDLQDPDFGPRIPWARSWADTDNRQHLLDDWCLTVESVPDDSWPISSSNIITVGGPYANQISRYFNEYAQALVFTTVGDGFYAVTCWDDALEHMDEIDTPSGFFTGGLVTDRFGYGVISTYKDKNGTIGFMVYGWTGQDTYYVSKWFDEHKFELQHINLHVTDLILRIEYKDADGDPYCPPMVEIVEKLGTISEKPQHDCP
jgi:hypothetical protein